MKMKKVLATVAAVAMAICMMPNMGMVAHAEPTGPSGDCNEKRHDENPCSYEPHFLHDSMCMWKCTVHISEGSGEYGTQTYMHEGDSCSVCGWTSAPAHTHDYSWMTDGPEAGTHTGTCNGSGECDNPNINEAHVWGSWNSEYGTRSCTKCVEQDVCDHNGATSGTCSTCQMNLGEEQQDDGQQGSTTPCTPVVEETTTTPSTPVVEKKPVIDETTFKVEIVENDTTHVSEDIAEEVAKDVYNLSQFTTMKGFSFGIGVAVKNEQAKNEVSEVKSTSVGIYTGYAQAFGKECIEVLKNSAVDVIYTFKHNGHLYRVTIPAGTDISALLDGNGFAGPLWIGQQLGTTEVIK